MVELRSGLIEFSTDQIEYNMNVLGYIFPGQSTEHSILVAEQQESILKFSKGIDENVNSFLVEESISVKSPFRQRKEGRRIMDIIQPGDSIITMKAEWVLGSAKEGLWLVKTLYNKSVSLYCIDLEENISLSTPRKLEVSEGGAALIKKILQALAVCENSKHGDSIRAAKKKMKEQGRYLGGPVPFGWKVENGYLRKNMEQQRVIKEIEKLRAERWSYRDIVGKLNKKFGVRLSHEGVRRILKNNEK